MSNWSHVKGTQPKRPDKILQTDDRVYLRKNITAVDDISPDETGQEENHTATPGWEYDEMILTKEEYEAFKELSDNPIYENDNDSLKSRISNIETFIATSTQE